MFGQLTEACSSVFEWCEHFHEGLESNKGYNESRKFSDPSETSQNNFTLPEYRSSQVDGENVLQLQSTASKIVMVISIHLSQLSRNEISLDIHCTPPINSIIDSSLDTPYQLHNRQFTGLSPLPPLINFIIDSLTICL